MSAEIDTVRWPLGCHARPWLQTLGRDGIVERLPKVILGWVAYAGVDPAAFIRRYAAHIAYLHIRDLALLDGQPRFTEVGRGTLDQRAIFDALDAISYRGWLVESEFNEKWGGLGEPRATATAQFTGLRETLSAWRATR